MNLNLSSVRKAVVALGTQLVAFAAVRLHLDPSIVVAADAVITTYLVHRIPNSVRI